MAVGLVRPNPDVFKESVKASKYREIRLFYAVYGSDRGPGLV